MFLIVRFGVYHWKGFEFEDGTYKDKYFITLNCKLEDKEIALVLPTSQVHKYQKFRSIDTIKILKDESIYFHKDTLIDLKNIKVVESAKIIKAHKAKRIKYLGLLEEKLQNRIIEAIKRAKTLSLKVKKSLLCDKGQS